MQVLISQRPYLSSSTSAGGVPSQRTYLSSGTSAGGLTIHQYSPVIRSTAGGVTSPTYLPYHPALLLVGFLPNVLIYHPHYCRRVDYPSVLAPHPHYCRQGFLFQTFLHVVRHCCRRGFSIHTRLLSSTTAGGVILPHRPYLSSSKPMTRTLDQTCSFRLFSITIPRVSTFLFTLSHPSVNTPPF